MRQLKRLDYSKNVIKPALEKWSRRNEVICFRISRHIFKNLLINFNSWKHDLINEHKNSNIFYKNEIQFKIIFYLQFSKLNLIYMKSK